MKPLDFSQIAPLLYLWVQESIIRVLGFSEHTLRLSVLLCGIGSLFVFRHLAGRLLRGTAYLLAVGTFSVAYPLVRHSAEAKPYGSDMFVSLVLLALAVEWAARPQERRWWWAVTLAMPLAVMLSYPAVFVAGGVGLAMASVLCWRGSWREWLRWGISMAALGGGFAASLAATAGGQLAASGAVQRAAFAGSFPPSLASPGRVAAFVLLNTNEAICYPVGGAMGPNLLSSLCCIVALIILVCGRRFLLLLLCVTPLALNFVAAAMHYYPYGEPWRMALFMAPVFCLLVGLGAAELLGLLALLPAMQIGRRALARLAIVLMLFVAIGVGGAIRDFLKPYKEPCWQRNCDFARWFWFDKAQGAELVCLKNDLGQRFYRPPQGDDLGSVYYCNQRIYFARLARGEKAQIDSVVKRVSASRPLRCVRFNPVVTTASDEAAFRQWLASFQDRYGLQLVGRERHSMFHFVKNDLMGTDHVELYEFVPKKPPGGATDRTGAAAAANKQD